MNQCPVAHSDLFPVMVKSSFSLTSDFFVCFSKLLCVLSLSEMAEVRGQMLIVIRSGEVCVKNMLTPRTFSAKVKDCFHNQHNILLPALHV